MTTLLPSENMKATLDRPKATVNIVLNLLAVVLLGLSVWFTIENMSVEVAFKLFGSTYQSSLAFVLLGMGILLSGATTCVFYTKLQAKQKDTKVSQRKVERLEVTAESSSERVKVLEHKIETLEIALKKALTANKQKS